MYRGGLAAVSRRAGLASPIYLSLLVPLVSLEIPTPLAECREKESLLDSAPTDVMCKMDREIGTGPPMSDSGVGGAQEAPEGLRTV